MKSFGDSLRSLSAMRRLQWICSMLAVVGCLYAVASIHSHDDGLHALGGSCISCSLEDVAAHGAAPSVVFDATANLSHIDSAISQAAAYVAVASISALIRAPPFFS
ncbi:hypothetical protein D8Y20_07455 [Mariprofundus sp. EBB-1]|uniref:hypothetical protein n=1 Tax=Mariprofundus sp. EBB-1 TaxID=2650971 RepID=UPI000EF1D6C5|nr:hypothetical protein [Mariprofundus sp. EBB-1]RLL52233.1 hypothetical protein D8Y20_07455 [Mariprofundus sp. EBB-1]